MIDFRSSVHPATARRRLEYFTALRHVLDARIAIDELHGRAKGRFDSNSPTYLVEMRYDELLRAQIRLAQAQIDLAERGGQS